MTTSKPTKAKTAVNAVVFLMLTLLGIALVNLLGGSFYKRLDTTSAKIYTLSPASRDIARTLPDRVNIKLFVSPELPPPFAETARFAKDLLLEYARESQGKINVEQVTVKSDDEKAKSLAQDYQVTPFKGGTVSDTEESQEERKLYLGVGLKYQDKVLAYPILVQIEGFEFEISGRINQLVPAKTRKKVLFASSEQEASVSANRKGASVSKFAELLQKSGHEVGSVDLKTALPNDADVLLVVGPRGSFSAHAKYVIDQFLMKGKSVGFFIDGQVETQSPQMMQLEAQGIHFSLFQPHQTGLEDLLTHYGLTPNPDLVLDQQAAPGIVIVNSMFGPKQQLVPHPAFVAANLAQKDNTLTAKLPGVVLVQAGSFTRVTNPVGNMQVTYQELLRSSKCSWLANNGFRMDAPIKAPPCLPGNTKERALAYTAVGTFRSLFAGKPAVPAETNPAQRAPSSVTETPKLEQSQAEGRLFVVGDSDFIEDQYLQHVFSMDPNMRDALRFYRPGAQMAANAIDWLAKTPPDHSFMDVRGKTTETRPLKKVESSTKLWIKVVNVAGVPLLVCLIGLIRWQVRRMRRVHARLN